MYELAALRNNDLSSYESAEHLGCPDPGRHNNFVGLDLGVVHEGDSLPVIPDHNSGGALNDRGSGVGHPVQQVSLQHSTVDLRDLGQEHRSLGGSEQGESSDQFTRLEEARLSDTAGSELLDGIPEPVVDRPQSVTFAVAEGQQQLTADPIERGCVVALGIPSLNQVDIVGGRTHRECPLVLALHSCAHRGDDARTRIGGTAGGRVFHNCDAVSTIYQCVSGRRTGDPATDHYNSLHGLALPLLASTGDSVRRRTGRPTRQSGRHTPSGMCLRSPAPPRPPRCLPSG